jgi:hypothetical protein
MTTTMTPEAVAEAREELLWVRGVMRPAWRLHVALGPQAAAYLARLDEALKELPEHAAENVTLADATGFLVITELDEHAGMAAVTMGNPHCLGCGRSSMQPCFPSCVVLQHALGGHELECEPFSDFDGSSACSCPDAPCNRGNFDRGDCLITCLLTQGLRHDRHVGVDPASDGEGIWLYVTWRGGGWCAGDPLPVKADEWHLDFEDLEPELQAALRQAMP